MENCFAKDENSTDDDDEERLVIKDDPLSQDEAEEQNVSAASSCDYNLSQFKKDESQFDASEEEMEQDNSQDEQDEDFKVEPKEEEESDEDVPLVRTVTYFFFCKLFIFCFKRSKWSRLLWKWFLNNSSTGLDSKVVNHKNIKMVADKFAMLRVSTDR